MSSKKSISKDVNPAPKETQLEEIAHRPPDQLKPYKGNARTHDEKQIVILMASIKEFGFLVPIITDEEGMILAGHGRVEAAKKLGLATVPTRIVAGLTKAQQRAYVLADNKISQLAKWDDQLLKAEIEILIKEDFNIETTGFSTAETDLILDDGPASGSNDPDDLQPEDVVEQSVTEPGDIWVLGNHRLICDSALRMETYALLMEGKQAQMVITDPPYNVPINGHVCGSGKIQHDEFAMASGEMDEGEFTDFLGTGFALINEFTKDGAIIYSFMDWRHQRTILNAVEPVFGPLRQLCIWVKDNGGMGTFYRSQHELVYVFKKGDAEHINNFGLGQYGRYRTNVWHYPGVNTFKGKGHDLLKLHPTVKPVGMIADAIRDCSKHKDLILDPFAGSGTVLIAAERTNRHARAIELEPKYVDVAVRRWQRATGASAFNLATRRTFEEEAFMRPREKSGIVPPSETHLKFDEMADLPIKKKKGKKS